MTEFTLPANSKVLEGRVYKNTQAFENPKILTSNISMLEIFDFQLRFGLPIVTGTIFKQRKCVTFF